MTEEIKKTPEAETPEAPEKVEVKEEKLLTQDQFNKALQERLAKEKAKFTEEVKTVKEEAERLAKLTAEEKEKEVARKNEEELKTKYKEVAIRENRLDAIELFAESKVPTELVTYVIDEDKDKTLENAEVFVKTFNESVAKSVAEQLKGTPPKDVSTSTDTGVKKVIKSF